MELAQVAFKRVGRIEMVRRLQHGQLGIAQHPAHRHLQKAARGHVVAVEDGHKRRTHAFQRGVDVARLGMFVVAASLVAGSGFEGELLKLLAPAVVQNVDVYLVRGPVHVQRAQGGVAHQVQRLVIGRNQNVDVRPFLGRVGQRHGRPAQRPDGLKVSQKENEEGIDLGQKQAHDEECVQRAPMVGRVVKKPHGLRDAPESVAEGAEDRHHHQRKRNQIGVGTAR